MLLYLLLPRKAFAPSLVPGPDPRWSLQLAAVVWSQAFYYRPHLPQQGKAVVQGSHCSLHCYAWHVPVIRGLARHPTKCLTLETV